MLLSRTMIAAGLMLSLVAAGCTKPNGDFKTASQIKDEKKAAGKAVHDHDHDHSAAGPHGGAIVELGDEEYHAEVVVDGKTHTLTVYLFGSDAKTPATTAAGSITVTTEDDAKLELKAVSGSGASKASEFALQDEAKIDAISKAGSLHGSLQLEINGKPYRGDIDAHFDGSSHDDHHDEKPAGNSEAKPADSSEKPTSEGSSSK